MRQVQLAVLLTAFAILPPAGAEPSPAQRRLTHVKSGWNAYQEGRIVEALHDYTAAVELSPDDPALWYDVGCLHAMNHEPEPAKAAFERALRLQPRLAEAYDGLGQYYELRGNFAVARELYATAASLNPANPRLVRHLSRILLQLHEEPAARRALQDLVAMDASDMTARYLLGLLALRAGQPDMAISEFRKVVEHDPDHAQAWSGLGLAYARIGDLERASGAIEHARLLDPESAGTLTNVGIVAARQERWDDARAAWQHALATDPQFSPAAQNLKTLDALLTSPGRQ